MLPGEVHCLSEAGVIVRVGVLPGGGEVGHPGGEVGVDGVPGAGDG